MGDFDSKEKSDSIITGKLPTMKTITRIPEYGEKSKDVGVVQTALKEKGNLITVDEDYGPRTKTVISTFQKLEGLEGSGNLGPKTIALLGIVVKEEPKSELPPDYVLAKTYAGKKETDAKFVA